MCAGTLCHSVTEAQHMLMIDRSSAICSCMARKNSHGHSLCNIRSMYMSAALTNMRTAYHDTLTGKHPCYTSHFSDKILRSAQMAWWEEMHVCACKKMPQHSQHSRHRKRLERTSLHIVPTAKPLGSSFRRSVEQELIPCNMHFN